MQLNFFRALANVLGLTWARVRSDFLSHSWVTITLGITVTALMFVPDADNYLRFDSLLFLKTGSGGASLRLCLSIAHGITIHGM